MVDRFIEKVANLAGRTAKALDTLASELEKEGFVTQPGILRAIAKSNRSLANDCATTTQPIEIGRYNLTARLKKIIYESRDVAADMLERGKPGHNELSEAADLMQSILDDQAK
jgi:hypothetical protein